MLLIGREREKERIGKIPGPAPSKSGKSRKNRERTKKDKKGRTKKEGQVQIGKPPRLKPPFSSTWQIMQIHISFRSRSDLVLDADHSLDFFYPISFCRRASRFVAFQTKVAHLCSCLVRLEMPLLILLETERTEETIIVSLRCVEGTYSSALRGSTRFFSSSRSWLVAAFCFLKRNSFYWGAPWENFYCRIDPAPTAKISQTLFQECKDDLRVTTALAINREAPESQEWQGN